MIHAKKSGFSLIEIMIAITIMGIIVAGTVTVFTARLNTARRTRARTELLTINAAIQNFEVHTHQYPQRLKDLIKRPQDERIAPRWEGPYLEGGEDRLRDPWGEKYQYKPSTGGDHKYELFSYGPGKKGGPKEDQISVGKN